ncbi:MAG: helix-turn-helix domain-containing protein [Nitrososphaera sp.]|jgi:sugar-specific transcriptional regulator TrmB
MAYIENKIAEAERTILAELGRLDLSQNEAKMLFNLMIRKNLTVAELAGHTGIARTEVYRYLESLLAKGVVHTTFDRPQRYYAMPYKDTIDHLVQIKMSTLRSVSEKKDDVNSIIDSLVNSVVQNQEGENDAYQVIIGEDALIAKVVRMIAKAEREVAMTVHHEELVMLNNNDVFVHLRRLASKGVNVKIKTSYQRASEIVKGKIHIEKMTAPLSLNCMICDDRELVIFLSKARAGQQKAKVFYTNSKLMAAAFKIVIERF